MILLSPQLQQGGQVAARPQVQARRDPGQWQCRLAAQLNRQCFLPGDALALTLEVMLLPTQLRQACQSQAYMFIAARLDSTGMPICLSESGRFA